MKEVKVLDEGGDSMSCCEHKGYLLPLFPDPNGIEGLDSVKIREDDVIIVTYPKSGTHWVFEITRELLSGQIIVDEVTMSSTFMEMNHEEKFADFPSPRILSTHVCLEQLPVDVVKKKTKIIYVLRHPKDVLVSKYSFLKKMPMLKYNGTWENFFTSDVLGKFIYGSWFDHVKSWEQVKKDHTELPILTLFYEDIKEDPIREMRKMCTFLGVERSEEFLARVRENTSFDKMKTQKSKTGSVVFRKGQVGNWKEWFTVAQNEWFDKVYEEKMADIQLPYNSK